MASYKLVAGSHVDADGKSYDKGDLIQSNDDLIRMFPNKFKRIRGGDNSAKEQSQKSPTPFDMDKAASLSSAEVAKIPQEGIDEDEDDGSELTQSSRDLGEDVTSKFPKAEKGGYKVFCKGDTYFVVDADLPEQTLNEEMLLNKTQVDKFVSNLLKHE